MPAKQTKVVKPKEGPVLGYAVMHTQNRVIITIGEDVRKNGLSPLDAVELARLLASNAMEADERCRQHHPKNPEKVNVQG
jgi:hypothetical protein